MRAQPKVKELYYFNVCQAYMPEHRRYDRCTTTNGRVKVNAKYRRLQKLYRYLKRAEGV